MSLSKIRKGEGLERAVWKVSACGRAGGGGENVCSAKGEWRGCWFGRETGWVKQKWLMGRGKGSEDRVGKGMVERRGMRRARKRQSS